MILVLDRLARALDRGIEGIGRVSAWLTLLLVLLVAGNVLARYFFHLSSVATQELEWHLLALLAMLGSLYTLQQNEHVRVDLFYQRYGHRARLALNLGTALLVIVPMALWIGWLSLDYVMQAYRSGEISPDPGGLPYRYLIKSVIPIGFVLIALQGLAMAMRDGLALFAPQYAHPALKEC
ncbi:MAG: TRAP transporter small permease subunit [Pseudomonadota bacterium]